MKRQEATSIARLHHFDFLNALDKYAADREALILIKNAVEDGRRDIRARGNNNNPAAADALRWMNRKLQDVDFALSRVKQTKTPGLSKTGGASAFVYSLTSSGEHWYEASLRRPEEYLANLCRTMDHDEIPVIQAFIPQSNIDSIPADWWDDTHPSKNSAEGVSCETEPHHELFSR